MKVSDVQLGGRGPDSDVDAARLLPSGDEAGSAPEDRAFRPDVEGLRAVAVLLVVLFHAGVGGLSGGYVGVDVFFVISGFVITGVLLRERSSAGSTSLLGFYARRCRRILPAATLVLVVTVVAAYLVLGRPAGARTADDAKWAAVFLANFHFAWAGTDYLAAGLRPSPLQNFWTLAVEEQFYLVFPTLFLVVAGLRTRVTLRTRMLVVLGALTVCSLAWSVVQTQTNPSYAYFSPFTRAWELGLGAMVALATPLCRKVPPVVASVLTWCGLAAIMLAGTLFDTQTPYPGILVAVPVVGAALVIVGGTANPVRGAETLLGLRPFRWLGRLSYSMYLWHWPILILAAESRGMASLPVSSNLLWLLVALAASVVTYRIVENPVRHSNWLRTRRGATIGLGIGLIALTLVVSSVAIAFAGPTSEVTNSARYASSADAATVERLVGAAPAITSLPTPLVPSLDAPTIGYPFGASCNPVGYAQTSMTPCLSGDPHGSKTMVLYGDSHSAMWFQTIDYIAFRAHWRLWYLGKSACPVELLPMMNPGGFGSKGGEFTQCDQWHTNAIARINQLRPDLVIVTQETHPGPGGADYGATEWQAGLIRFFSSITTPNVQFDVIGNIPRLPSDPPQCLSAHSSDVQACSAARAHAVSPYGQAEAAAVGAVGGRYVDVTPWFCSAVCTAVISHYQVYFNQEHVMGPYAAFLDGVMADALRLPPGTDTAWRVSTRVILPRPGAVLSGMVALSAIALVPGGSHVEFLLTGHGYNDKVVAVAQPTLVGWISVWNSTAVPNGTYMLRSRARSMNGGVGLSSPVPVQVAN